MRINDELSIDQQRIIAAIINGVSNASWHNAKIRQPTNGRSINSVQRGSIPNANTGGPVVSFDHLGNPL